METDEINLKNLDKRIRILEIEISMITRKNKKGSHETAILSEKSLKKEWLTEEENEAWKDL